jgi:periplasmic divalent cation tolerance protein
MPAVLVYVTAPSRDVAKTIAHTLVNERLAACANILDGMISVYRWQGAIEEAREAVLILKTRRELADRVVARVKSLHPYEVPAILVLPVEGGSQPFLDWIRTETQE